MNFPKNRLFSKKRSVSKRRSGGRIKFKKNPIVHHFFVETNNCDVFRIIFSYITHNEDIFSFSMICKQVQLTFQDMLERSSTRLYRLNLLNMKMKSSNESVPRSYCFDIFGRNYMNYKLCPELFVSNIEEFIGSFDSHQRLLFDILSAVNAKYGPVCLISGSFALEHFLKEKSFSKFVYKKQLLRMDGRRITKEGMNNHPADDIDIFLLGKKKLKVFKTILKTIKKNSKNPEQYKVNHRHRGLYDITKTLSNGKEYVFQFILKSLHTSESDVFAFFDLDCCKIGIIPSEKETKVVTCSAFIRSVMSGINYLDLVNGKAGWKHFHRICKYFRRTNIYTTCQPEPLLSYYHDFKSIDVSKTEDDIVMWDSNAQSYSYDSTVTRYDRRYRSNSYYVHRSNVENNFESHTIVSRFGWTRYGYYSDSDGDDSDGFDGFSLYDMVVGKKRNSYCGTVLPKFIEKLKRKEETLDEELFDENNSDIPYICFSVGIQFDKKRRVYYYENEEDARKKQKEERRKDIEKRRERMDQLHNRRSLQTKQKVAKKPIFIDLTLDSD